MVAASDGRAYTRGRRLETIHTTSWIILPSPAKYIIYNYTPTFILPGFPNGDRRRSRRLTLKLIRKYSWCGGGGGGLQSRGDAWGRGGSRSFQLRGFVFGSVKMKMRKLFARFLFSLRSPIATQYCSTFKRLI